jgi:hypothetical protein
MKNLIIVAVALASVNAFASRARVIALGNSAHLIDTQTVLSNPSDILMIGDYVNFESGTNADPSNGAQYANAEGTITRSMGESKLGLTLGNQSKNASIWGLRSVAATGIATIVSQQNPVTVTYGMKMNDMMLGANLVYSNFNDKFNDTKESSSGVRFGLRTGAIDAKLGIGLSNTFSTATEKFKGTTGISGGFGYMMDNNYFNVAVEAAGFKTETPTPAATDRKFDSTTITLGALQSHKKDGSELFYGIALSSEARKLEVGGGEQKTTLMSLPITVGMEVDAASWLALRGSIKQSTLISNEKRETGGTTTLETAPGLNTTVAVVGAGLKFNKLTIDGSLEGLSGSTATQAVNGTTLLGTVGLTYLF